MWIADRGGVDKIVTGSQSGNNGGDRIDPGQWRAGEDFAVEGER
jgi:hypothetical protein